MISVVGWREATTLTFRRWQGPSTTSSVSQNPVTLNALSKSKAIHCSNGLINQFVLQSLIRSTSHLRLTRIIGSAVRFSVGVVYAFFRYFRRFSVRIYRLFSKASDRIYLTFSISVRIHSLKCCFGTVISEAGGRWIFMVFFF